MTKRKAIAEARINARLEGKACHVYRIFGTRIHEISFKSWSGDFRRVATVSVDGQVKAVVS